MKEDTRETLAAQIAELTAQRDELMATVEKGFLEGYTEGYNSGSSDAAAYEWGTIRGDLAYQKDKQRAWDDSDTKEAIARCQPAEEKP